MDFTKHTLFSRLEIPENFLCDVIDCAKFFKQRQESAILRNLALYNIPSLPEEEVTFNRLKYNIANRYFKKYRLKKISRSQQLIAVHKSLVAHWKIESGFQNNRSLLPRLSNITHSDWVKLEAELNDISSRVNEAWRKEWTPSENWRDSINIISGKRYDSIENSKFCYSRVLNILSFLLKNKPGNDVKKVGESLQFDQQRAVLDSFWSTVNSLEEDQDFLLSNNISILSRFSVSSVWLIAHLFSKVLFR